MREHLMHCPGRRMHPAPAQDAWERMTDAQSGEKEEGRRLTIMDKQQKSNIVRLRAHHGMCLAYFEGKGYSSAFTDHMTRIRQELEAQPERLVEVVAEVDVICAACPNCADGVCSSAGKVKRYDESVMILLEGRVSKEAEGKRTEERRTADKYTEGEHPVIMTYGRFSGLVRERILLSGKREGICRDCQWNEICTEKDTSLRLHKKDQIMV